MGRTHARTHTRARLCTPPPPGRDADIKYIEPTQLVRAVPPSSTDRRADEGARACMHACARVRVSRAGGGCRCYFPTHPTLPPHARGRISCKMLGHGAVHAAFAGYTGTAVGQASAALGARAASPDAPARSLYPLSTHTRALPMHR